MSRAPATRFDLLRLPLVGRFLRWRYARFALQLPLLLLALLAILEGLLGSQLAAKNLATVSVWLHYRGLVVLALLIIGNLFCAACPLMLTRGPTRLLKRFVPELRWPRALRNKYTVLALTAAYIFAYEYFDLWASPWLTAWLMIGYFGAALVIDTLFPAGTFCRYVCPLGNFNFALSHGSPSQITARDPSRCASCEGKYCLNGRVEDASGRGTLRGTHRFETLTPLAMAGGSPAPVGHFPGCETELFVPALKSNQDCTLCLNCLRACPYDNVALELRPPARSWEQVRPKADWLLLGTVLFFAGLANAFAMVPPFYALAERLSGLLGTRSEGVLLPLLLGPPLLLGTLGSLGVFVASSRLLGLREGWSAALRRWGAVLLPMSFAMWAGHYSFHFLTGWASIIPAFWQALATLGLPVPPPDWTLAALVPENFLFPLQVVILYSGFGAGCYFAFRRARALGNPRAALPILAWLGMLSVIALLILAQPMEMRGTLLDPGTASGAPL
ncbi:polyferredoxin [Deinobacterium chartae]|uniref:Polyferredoxin n=1 Tax=Deinobacterium chartae TaxID=521158 RepID=A0A841I5R4_9DEIO|nr:4Fe-4S ferredoxin [Deinobacterium chartae]MBB6099609.1 polyferredoxin [Deinobacterium chartae]